MRNLYISSFNPNEVYTCASRIAAIIIATISADPFILKVQPLLTAKMSDLSLVLGRTNDSTYVKNLRSKDKVRDTRFIALRDYCHGFLNDEDPAIAGAAATIVNIIKELGWSMHLHGDSIESSELETLFEKLAQAPASAAITTLKATAKLTSLKTAQVDFEDTYHNKVDAKAKEDYPKIQNCRRAIFRYVNGMLTYIDLMAEIDGGAFKTAADKIDEVITEFESIAHSRQTRKENEKTKPGKDSAK